MVVAHRKRRRRGSALPTRREDLPAWLAETYGVVLEDGEPRVAGVVEASTRAYSVLTNRRVLWREKMRTLRAEAREATSAAKKNQLRLEAARAEVAMREGKPFPRADVIARSEFLITLDLHRDEHGLPFIALCLLAWWANLLPRHPSDPDVQREARELLRRHW